MTDILIVEDNRELAHLLKDFLLAEKYTVAVAHTGEEALVLFEGSGARLVVLDILLPGMDGFAVCARLREQSEIPILILTVRTKKSDKLLGLELGADDYMEKPYDVDILLAKIKGIFKRKYAQDELVDDNLRLNRASRTVCLDGKPLELTIKEFDLLTLLLENKGRALQKEYLFDKIWGRDSFSEQQTLTVHIKWLRQKIEDDPKNPKRILTIWGVGYKWN